MELLVAEFYESILSINVIDRILISGNDYKSVRELNKSTKLGWPV